MSKNKTNIPLRLAGILFCLTLVSTYMTSGFYARYISRSTGDDYTNIVDFGNLTLTESGTFQSDGTMIIIPGVDLTKNAVIKFEGSETSTFVFAEIETSPDWALTNNSFSMKQDSKTFMNWDISEEWTYLCSNNNTHVYYQELSPNTDLESNLVANDGLFEVSNQITSSDLASINNTYIKFRASVIQSNGFESPINAWDAIKE